MSSADPTIPLVLNAIGVNQANGWSLNFVDLGGSGLFTVHEYATWKGSSGQWANAQEQIEGASLVGANFSTSFDYSALDNSLWPYLRWFQLVSSDDQGVAESSESPFVRHGNLYSWIDGGQPIHSYDNDDTVYPPTIFYDGPEFCGGASSWANPPLLEARPPLWWELDDPTSPLGMLLSDSPWIDVTDGQSATLSFSTYVGWVTDSNGTPIDFLGSVRGPLTLNLTLYGLQWGCVLQ
jgi:hypothetical protein